MRMIEKSSKNQNIFIEVKKLREKMGMIEKSSKNQNIFSGVKKLRGKLNVWNSRLYWS
jgi:hypothetical protein